MGTVAGLHHQLPPGPVKVEIAFLGGTDPVLTAFELVANDYRSRLPEGQQSTGRGLATLVRALHDAAFVVRAEPDGEVLVKMDNGLEAVVPEGGTITLTAVVEGPPDAPLLCAPLEAKVGGEGIRVSHSSVRWLAALAQVRIHRVALHPDGSVEIQSHKQGSVLDRAVDRGLRKASNTLSDLVRNSPRFERVRTFLPSG